MISEPVGLFLQQLGKVSGPADRYLRHRNVEKADREDIVSAAIAWCWEHRADYSLTMSVEAWFSNAVRDAFKAWARDELQNRAEVMSALVTGDGSLAQAQALSAAAALIGTMPRAYRRVLWLDMQGYTRDEMLSRGVRHRTIDEARAKARSLRRLLPDPVEYQDTVRAVPVPLSDGNDEDASDDFVADTATQAPEELSAWARTRPARIVKGLPMFEPLETHQLKIRRLLNKRAGLELDFMPDYVPPKHWKQ